MENASKALIIAGAILLAILIISLGILVYNQAADTVDEANLDSESLQTFNAKFTSYEGSSQSAATVRTLISLINASNQTEESSARGLYITLTSSSTAPSATTSATSCPSDYSASSVKTKNGSSTTSGVLDTATYEITLLYADGAVRTINIYGTVS